ncbi:MAG TPA: DUF6242 domain-containing protein [Prevotella sp.]
MRKKLLSFAVLVSAVFFFGSCLGNSDDEVVYYNDTALTAFTLGTLNQYGHTTSSTGKDSAYKAAVTGSEYAFYIDQIKNEIYNPDSLPYGTDAKHVICTITSKNSGTIVLKSMTSDSLRYYSSTDSIDFSQPRTVYVYNPSGTAFKAYTVKVNVHQQEGETFNWLSGLPANTRLAALTAMKAVACNGTIYVFGRTAAGFKAYSTAETDGKEWQELTPSVALTADAYQSVVAKGNKLYVADGGVVYSSADATSWEQVAAAAQIRQLIGATDAKIYALQTDGKLAVSADEGSTWATEELDAPGELFPTESLSFAFRPMETNENTNKIVLVGNRSVSAYAADGWALVWGKVEENAPYSENQPWSYYEVLAGNHYVAPRLNGLQAVGYGNSLVALGGEGLGACTAAPFAKFYESKDGGITWKPSENIKVPASFSAADQVFAMAKDSRNFIWIICGTSGQVWKGRLNKMGWATAPTSFYK